MIFSSSAFSLVLIVSTLSLLFTAIADQSHQYLHLKDRSPVDQAVSYTPTTVNPCVSTQTTCITDSPRSNLPCDKINGTNLVGSISVWTLICDTDFYAQDIYPFISAGSFEGCLGQCEDYNLKNGEGSCLGFVFAPDRLHLDNDCYLKSGLNDAIYPATIHLVGAISRSTLGTATSRYPVTVTQQPPATSSIELTPAIVAAPSTEHLRRGRAPTVANSTFLGTSVDEVAKHYVSHAPAQPAKLSGNALQAGINTDLITSYQLASDTGTWTIIDATGYNISNMTVIPRISRDGGRGGNVNGTNIFIFCDTSTYGQAKDPTLGYLNGFVSSSVAVDRTMNALNDQPLSLDNTLGQWQDDVGRMRGFVAMTIGEEAFNIAVSGQGYRYAVWPNSSPISLNTSHAIMYAPLVYLEVDMQDQSSTSYTSLGNTLLSISVDPIYGPHADRLYNQFFQADQVSWGSLGGIRAWSSSGQNSPDGSIYLFGQADNGVLIGKVPAKSYNDLNMYKYWNGNSWSEEMPPTNSTSNAFLLDQSIMNMDVIYSPGHMTFIMVYLTSEADNTFYYRYLIGQDNSTLTIIPPYEDGGEEDYVENLIQQKWSEQRVLFSIPTPARGYAYAGGLHAGYFGEDDITNGGMKMLLSWTEHTKVDPNVPNSGYAHKTQIIDFGFTG